MKIEKQSKNYIFKKINILPLIIYKILKQTITLVIRIIICS